MKIQKEIITYCPYCNKHTPHIVKMVSKRAMRGLSLQNRRHERKIRGYVGKVKAKTPVKKLAKRQVILLECRVCGKIVERTLGVRTKKKIEIKR